MSGWDTGGQVPRHHRYSTPPLFLPPKIFKANTVMCKNNNKKTFRKNPLGDLLSIICAAREAPVNDKATEKHHGLVLALPEGREAVPEGLPASA